MKIRVTYNYYNYVNVALLLNYVHIICSIPTCTLTHTQPHDPCPAYPVGSYNFTITERDTDQLVTSVIHTGNISLVVGGSNGLETNQIYMLMIEAMNTVGSSISEDEILFCKHIHIWTKYGLLTLSTRYNYLTDTTGLQSFTAAVELNGSITVTCIFVTGASSTGCQLTIFTIDNVYIFSRNITRPNKDSPVSYQQCLQ